MITEESVLEVLKQVAYPGFSRDIVSFGLVRECRVENSDIHVRLEVTSGDAKIPGQIKKSAEHALRVMDGVGDVHVSIVVSKKEAPKSNAASSLPEQSEMEGVKHIVAVASGKGGVGKSTFVSNLACAINALLHEKGLGEGKVGIMDCDIYGPSIPLMMGIGGRPEIEDNMIYPMLGHGVKVMSMGFLVDEGSPIIWRGPMVMKAIQQFTHQVKWGELEFMLIDLPPGTGDAQISLTQTLRLDGALIVTTPQAAAYTVARRGAGLFDKVEVPLLGVAENMSYLELPVTGEKHYLFGQDGGKHIAEDLGTELLGQIPLEQDLREGGDRGIPQVIANPESSASQAFRHIASKLIEQVEKS